MYEEKCNKKKSSLAGKLLAVVGAFALVNFAGGIGICLKNLRKIKDDKNENNIVNTAILHKDVIEVKEDTDNAYLGSVSSCLDICLSKPVKGYMNIELTSYFSFIRLHVPADVVVTFDTPSDLPKEDNLSVEGLSKIHVCVKGKFSKIKFINE